MSTGTRLEPGQGYNWPVRESWPYGTAYGCWRARHHRKAQQAARGRLFIELTICPSRSVVRLLAGRSGQLRNLSATAADLGIDHNTVKAWISVLEAGFLVHRLPPYFANLGKRLVKSPELYFLDLLHRPGETQGHPRGSSRAAVPRLWWRRRAEEDGIGGDPMA